VNCNQFKAYWFDSDINDLDDELQDKVFDHFHSCRACSDAVLAKSLLKRGVSISDYPCVHMAQYAEFYCEQHPDPKECHDAVIQYDEVFDEYSIPHGDGISQMMINNCPWCGVALPESKRDLWFDTLASMGYDDPWEQDIPGKFKSKQWRLFG
tara:strand:- start:1229 stop:1687 length:459 start_codon:yes stop_codon:yes gene_type:complete